MTYTFSFLITLYPTYFLWLEKLNSFITLTDHRGYSNTFFGKVRRVTTPFNWGVKTCPHFSCKTEDAVFIIRNMVRISAAEKAEWSGYTFFLNDLADERRPPHSFDENERHPPMMANTHCIERNETPNISLHYLEDMVILEASRPIGGNESLLVDYGDDYNSELFRDRQAARERRAKELMNRKNIAHNYTCDKCGHTCHSRLRIKHYNKCKATALDGMSNEDQQPAR